MCTLTLFRGQGELLITMNRDEKRRRAPEIEPRVYRSAESGIGWLGPRDGEAGGTWIGVNDRGLAACLMNRYPDSPPRAKTPKSGTNSRGAIVPLCLEHASLLSAAAWIDSKFDPRRFGPFTLVLVCRLHARAITWNGGGDLETRRLRAGWTFLSSSSWNQAEVLPWRAARFRKWRQSGCGFAGPVPAFNLLCVKGYEAWSPLMERRDGATRSLTQIQIKADSRIAWMNYLPRPTENNGTGPISEDPRAARATHRAKLDLSRYSPLAARARKNEGSRHECVVR